MAAYSDSEDASKRAFLNVPFDAQFEPLFLAFISGLSGFGLTPQCVLQIPTSHRPLDRLTQLISSCHYSFHDLSPVELDRRRPIGVFRCLSNALVRTIHRPTVQQLQGIYLDVNKRTSVIKRGLATDSLFATRPFPELVVAASRSAKDRVPSLSQPSAEMSK